MVPHAGRMFWQGAFLTLHITTAISSRSRYGGCSYGVLCAVSLGGEQEEKRKLRMIVKYSVKWPHDQHHKIPKLKPCNHMFTACIPSCTCNLFLFQCPPSKKHSNWQSVIQSILQCWQLKKELVGGFCEGGKSILHLGAAQMWILPKSGARSEMNCFALVLLSEQMILQRQFLPPQAIKCQAITLPALG